MRSGAAKGSGRIPARSGLDPGPIVFRSHFAALHHSDLDRTAVCPRRGRGQWSWLGLLHVPTLMRAVEMKRDAACPGLGLQGRLQTIEGKAV